MTLTYDEATRPDTTGPGRPLDASTRGRMERELGHDFGDVVVHTGAEAARAAGRARARAYAAGSHVVFGAGQWAPGTEHGDGVLAHELAHVAQQRRIGPRVQRDGFDDEDLRDPWEREADRVTRRRRGSTMTRQEARRLLQSPGAAPAPAVTPAPAPVVPQAATVTDPRAAVLPADTTLRDDLLKHLQAARTAIQGLLASPPSGEPWVTSANANIQSLMALLDSLITDLQANALVIRFDQPAGAASASYEPLDGLMHLRRFTDPIDMRAVASSLVHEYAHVMQDRAVEQALATTLKPRIHTAADELKQEVDARREETYFTRLVDLVGLTVNPADPFGETLTARIFVSQFEQIRAGGKAGAAAKLAVDKKIGGYYASQIKAQSPAPEMPVEINPANHAVLHHPGGTVDLGVIPTVTTHAQLQAEVATLLRAWSGYQGLFTGTGGVKYPHIAFTIVHGGTAITQVALPP